MRGKPARALVRTDQAPRLELTTAVLLYEGTGQLYATVHAVLPDRTLAAGVPATRESCAHFAAAFAQASAFAGFLAPEMLYLSPRVAAWWRAPAPARVFFDSPPRADGKGLGIRNAITPHPGLVFVLAPAGWHVYALRAWARPDPATPIYRAPYFNVWRDGRICEGNLERPARVTAENLQAFARGFFDSRFTHPNVTSSRELTTYQGGLYGLWDLLTTAGGHDIFPAHTLVRHGKHTLATLMRELEGQQQ